MQTTAPAVRVAEKVAEAMAGRGVSQLELSNATLIPRATLQRRLGGVTPFTVAELYAIAEHLGVTASELVAAA